jgi:hypothetical protein
MKKIIASVGFAALGVSTLHAQYSPGPAPANPRGWSVALSVRAFYDDNYLTLPNPSAVSSYGEEVSPSVSLDTKFNNTALSLSYVYDMLYYDRDDIMDSSHQFSAYLNQQFSERYNLQIGETFVIAQQPTVQGSGIGVSSGSSTPVLATPLYSSGDNIHNDASISLTAGLTPLLDLQLSYVNDLYAYQQTFGDVVNFPGMTLNPSRSALLDRMDQLTTVNLNWKMMKQLTWVVGYSYGHTGYTSPEPIVFNSASYSDPLNIHSQTRDNDSHFFFVGADRELTSQLTGRIRVGGQYLDYYNAGADAFSPYVDASVTYIYMKDSSLQAGVTHQHNATDVVGAIPATTGPNRGQPVLDAEATAAYLSLRQKITGGLTGGLMGQFQHSAFNGGTEDGHSEDFFITGLNIAYQFNPYLSAETGYNWNKLVSDVSGRDYTRNIVYIGVRATY